MNELKDRLNAAMKKRRKSAADLARAVGKSESAISQWLSGDVKSMRSDSLMATCRFLQCNPEWLASNKGVSGLDEAIESFEQIPPGAFQAKRRSAFKTAPNLASHLREVSKYLLELSDKGKVHAKSALAVLVDDPSDFEGVAAAIMVQLDLANDQVSLGRQPESTSLRK